MEIRSDNGTTTYIVQENSGLFPVLPTANANILGNNVFIVIPSNVCTHCNIVFTNNYDLEVHQNVYCTGNERQTAGHTYTGTLYQQHNNYEGNVIDSNSRSLELEEQTGHFADKGNFNAGENIQREEVNNCNAVNESFSNAAQMYYYKENAVGSGIGITSEECQNTIYCGEYTNGVINPFQYPHKEDNLVENVNVNNGVILQQIENNSVSNIYLSDNILLQPGIIINGFNNVDTNCYQYNVPLNQIGYDTRISSVNDGIILQQISQNGQCPENVNFSNITALQNVDHNSYMLGRETVVLEKSKENITQNENDNNILQLVEQNNQYNGSLIVNNGEITEDVKRNYYIEKIVNLNNQILQTDDNVTEEVEQNNDCEENINCSKSDMLHEVEKNHYYYHEDDINFSDNKALKVEENAVFNDNQTLQNEDTTPDDEEISQDEDNITINETLHNESNITRDEEILQDQDNMTIDDKALQYEDDNIIDDEALQDEYITIDNETLQDEDNMINNDDETLQDEDNSAIDDETLQIEYIAINDETLQGEDNIIGDEALQDEDYITIDNETLQDEYSTTIDETLQDEDNITVYDETIQDEDNITVYDETIQDEDNMINNYDERIQDGDNAIENNDKILQEEDIINDGETVQVEDNIVENNYETLEDEDGVITGFDKTLLKENSEINNCDEISQELAQNCYNENHIEQFFSDVEQNHSENTALQEVTVCSDVEMLQGIEENAACEETIGFNDKAFYEINVNYDNQELQNEEENNHHEVCFSEILREVREVEESYYTEHANLSDKVSQVIDIRGSNEEIESSSDNRILLPEEQNDYHEDISENNIDYENLQSVSNSTNKSENESVNNTEVLENVKETSKKLNDDEKLKQYVQNVNLSDNVPSHQVYQNDYYNENTNLSQDVILQSEKISNDISDCSTVAQSFSSSSDIVQLPIVFIDDGNNQQLSQLCETVNFPLQDPLMLPSAMLLPCSSSVIMLDSSNEKANSGNVNDIMNISEVSSGADEGMLSEVENITSPQNEEGNSIPTLTQKGNITEIHQDTVSESLPQPQVNGENTNKREFPRKTFSSRFLNILNMCQIKNMCSVPYYILVVESSNCEYTLPSLLKFESNSKNYNLELKQEISNIMSKHKYIIGFDILQHITKNVWKCGMCGDIVENRKSLEFHVESVHADFRTRKLRLRCIECFKGFLTKASLKDHMIYCHSDVSIVCPECNCYDFYNNFAFIVHILKHICPFKLKFVSGDFITFNPFNLPHYKIAKGLYECPICKKTFSTTHLIKNHLYQHINILTLKCSKCSTFFVNEQSLKAHAKKHKPKCRKCNNCNVMFDSIIELEKHQNKSKYHVKCEICNKFYKHVNYLANHMVITHHVRYPGLAPVDHITNRV